MQNFKNICVSVLLVLIVALTGCGACESTRLEVNEPKNLDAGEGLPFKGVFDNKEQAEDIRKWSTVGKEIALNMLYDVLHADDIDDDYAWKTAKDVFDETGNDLAWSILADGYFSKRPEAAFVLLEKFPESGFASAVVKSVNYSIKDKRKAVDLFKCDKRVIGEFISFNQKQFKPGETKSLWKKYDLCSK